MVFSYRLWKLRDVITIAILLMMFDGLGLQTISYVSTNPTIVAGNTADESSLVLLALSVVNENRARLYNVQNFSKN